MDEDGKEFRENTSDLVYLLRSNNEVHYILLLFRSKDSFLDLAAAAHVEVCICSFHNLDSINCSQTYHVFALSRQLVMQERMKDGLYSLPKASLNLFYIREVQLLLRCWCFLKSYLLDIKGVLQQSLLFRNFCGKNSFGRTCWTEEKTSPLSESKNKYNLEELFYTFENPFLLLSFTRSVCLSIMPGLSGFSPLEAWQRLVTWVTRYLVPDVFPAFWKLMWG